MFGQRIGLAILVLGLSSCLSVWPTEETWTSTALDYETWSAQACGDVDGDGRADFVLYADFEGGDDSCHVGTWIVASADRKPTSGSVKYYDVLKGRLEEVVAEYHTLLEHDVADFNRDVEGQKVPRIAPAPKIEK